jgi:hypothetical protein
MEIVKKLGGASTEDPFARAEEMFRIAFELWKDNQLSNKKFKKARREFEEALRADRAQKKMKEQERQESIEAALASMS